MPTLYELDLRKHEIDDAIGYAMGTGLDERDPAAFAALHAAYAAVLRQIRDFR
jgi:hypothetical protein